MFVVFLTYILYPCIRMIVKLSHTKEYRLGLGSGFLGVRLLDNIFPLSEVSFEGKIFPAPANTDAICPIYMEIIWYCQI